MYVFYYTLMVLSVLAETAKNVFSNNFSKQTLKTETDVYKFDTLLYFGSFILLCFLKWEAVSVFTFICAVVFAAALWLNQHFFLKALRLGSMGFSTFIQGISLVIPIIYGTIFLDGTISTTKKIALIFLIASLWLSLGVKEEKVNIRWLCYSIFAMIFLGVIGILQTTHQNSPHKGEFIGFLRVAFLITAVINLTGYLLSRRKTPESFVIKSKATPLAVSSGIFMGFVHIINLYLSGVFPQIIFFPVVNGGLIFTTLISGLIFFKEKLDAKQLTGIIIGIAALSVISV